MGLRKNQRVINLRTNLESFLELKSYLKEELRFAILFV